MGIKGLLVELRPITDRIHISEFSGKRIGIDASCWLHRAAFTCTMQLMLDKPTKAWLTWCISMIEMLVQNGITPVFVFDGIALPQKQDVNDKRREQRATARERGLQLLESGNSREAATVFQQAISISPEMQREFIMALRSRNIEYVVAPYEADAQLGFLFQSGDVDAVISEDSDLVLFGVRRLITKFAKDGFGQLTDMARLNSPEAKKAPFTDALRSLTHEQFLTVCIMSGCDYLDGLPGIGLKTALKYARQHSTSERIIRAYSRKSPLPPEYAAKFRRALLTFQHQRVYDRSTESLCHLSGVEQLDDDGDFLGPALSDEIVQELVIGARDTKTMAVVSLDDPPPPPAVVDAPVKTKTSGPISVGLKHYSDNIDLNKDKTKDFHNDIAMIQGVFGDRRLSVTQVFSKGCSVAKSTIATKENISPSMSRGHSSADQSARSCSANFRNESSNIAPLPSSQTSTSNKRPGPRLTGTWVKKIKKPVQHLQRRLTDFFAVKPT